MPDKLTPDHLTKLLEYCDTECQASYIKAVIQHDGMRAASRALGVHDSTIVKCIKRARRNAARRGYAPEYGMTREVPDGFYADGVSTYYKATPDQPAQWVKSKADKDRQRGLMLEAVKAVAQEYRGTSARIAAPRRTDADLMSVYPLGDPHIGLYAYSKETGVDFDLEIAQRNLIAAADRVIDAGPDAETGIILSLGDFYHAETSENRSVNGGHSFDVDTRWSKVMLAGIMTMRRMIDRALDKHKHVIVRCNAGNHDPHMSPMLAIALQMYYENNQRVLVDTSPAYYWFHRFGRVLIGSTHGDQCKPADLPAIMADEVASDWGESRFRYWYTGHIHTTNKTEYRGVVWESFRTLAGRDAWHAKKGYSAGRDMYAITHHREEGEIERHRVDVSTLP